MKTDVLKEAISFFGQDRECSFSFSLDEADDDIATKICKEEQCNNNMDCECWIAFFNERYKRKEKK